MATQVPDIVCCSLIAGETAGEPSRLKCMLGARDLLISAGQHAWWLALRGPAPQIDRTMPLHDGTAVRLNRSYMA